MKKMNFKKGFTLIELLIVVAIIAILSTIVLAYLGSARGKSQDAKIVSQVSQMTSQSFLYSGVTSVGGVAGPVNTGIANPLPAGTAPLQLFNATTSTLNSLYKLGSSLPGSPYIYYGWNGADPNTTGAWFFAVATSTGAFCNDHRGSKVTYTGTAISSAPTLVASWTTAFPNGVTAANGYDCN